MVATHLSGTCFAHRGLHNAADGVIENSQSSVARAIDLGFGVEIDVQRSSDDVAIVFHDFELERLTDLSGRVGHMPAVDLEKISLKNSSDRLWRLSDFLRLVDGRVPILIEIKSDWSPQKKFVERIFIDLAAYPGVCGLMSFDPDLIMQLEALGCDHLLGLVATDFNGSEWADFESSKRAALQSFEAAKNISLNFIAHDVRDLERDAVHQLVAQHSLELLSWTVRSKDHLRRALKAKAAPIFEGGEALKLLRSERGIDVNRV